MILYIYGCQDCGVNATYVRKLKAYCANIGETLEVKNTKYDSDALYEHIERLSSAGIITDSYQPIVVDEDNATLLRNWKW